MNVSEFVLKATPPRMPGATLQRAHLLRERQHECTALVVIAPAGFGKTTVLLQWRRDWLAVGAHVAWCSASDADRPVRFLLALRHAMRVGGVLELEADDERAAGRGDVYASMTLLLAAIAERRAPVGLVIDDAERLPEDTVRGVLQYLLLNAPPNLHVAIGSRVALPVLLSELVAKGACATLGIEDLRLRLAESDAILASRLGDRLTIDDRALLHDATEGWAIGLQLAISSIEREPDPARAARALSARRGALQEYFVTSLFAHLPSDMEDALVRASILEHFDADLFQTVTGSRQSRAMLDRLARETPLMVVDEGIEWMRLQPLARDFLLSRFEALPPRERATLHGRASRWYAGRDRFHEAATHALAAGNEALAQEYAARALWALATNGMLSEAREWLERLPEAMIEGDTELRLVAASVLALGERNDQALAIAHAVLDEPDITPRERAMALRIGVVSALFADRVGQLPRFLAEWPQPAEEGIGPLHAMAELNSRAVLALHEGDTLEVRALVAQESQYGESGTVRLSAAFGRMLVALSHLWDGHPARAEVALMPALLHAEQHGRRGMIASLHASFVALACYERGHLMQARTLLSGRLDVIERCGFPDNVLSAYRTLASIASEEGDEARAHAALQALDAIGIRRGWPRLRVAALAEQLRLHAVRGRKDAMARLLVALEAMAPEFDATDRLPLRAGYRLVVMFSRAQAALALDRLDEADAHLALADALAQSLNRDGDVQRTKVLRAIVASKRGDKSAPSLLREARELAAIGGHARLAADTHPLAVGLLSQSRGVPGRVAPPIPDRPLQDGLLTAKEFQVLALLRKGLPNKAIARDLDVSGETVKSHLKSLFVKLSAGSRHHAVERARLLGLLP
ncbi:LuxR C-terminal-related transcriptional regulator [Lysobacter sp. KIS68-7]|uniref:LuxR C-terminal-related transcriptional regulator n=1 Tax=Lysobacter sp. KIS68-7 TaxID=2904252 RepID=UPI001E3270BD|nr:LuxR C-terminal-related transcriptional regulator [Lysobacter sp. KIS68-7]UHQ20050.1 LuxR C-terminal-related transcriptional regulator [Lysobacter sp. KIS68-7]